MQHGEGISDPNQSLDTITVFMQTMFDHEWHKKLLKTPRNESIIDIGTDTQVVVAIVSAAV